MMTPFPPKTPMQMRREAEQRGKPRTKPLAEPDPSKRPLQASDNAAGSDAAADWLAHLQAGRIEVR